MCGLNYPAESIEMLSSSPIDQISNNAQEVQRKKSFFFFSHQHRDFGEKHCDKFGTYSVSNSEANNFDPSQPSGVPHRILLFIGIRAQGKKKRIINKR